LAVLAVLLAVLPAVLAFLKQHVRLTVVQFNANPQLSPGLDRVARPAHRLLI
jgi:hypothetical protein